MSRSRRPTVMDELGVMFSVSTWQPPMPSEPAPDRARVIDRIVAMIDSIGDRRLRVGIDGFTAAGKTTLGHELARALAHRGRPALRASLDDFKRPWSERHLYDRVSPEGYYRNAFDSDAARRLLLEPAAPGGDGWVALCSIDPQTQINHAATKTEIAPNGVLIVDGVFAFRPELDSCWDLRIWVEIDADLSLRRAVERDSTIEADAAALHRDRYLPAELLYVAEVDPRSFVDVIIDNIDIEHPRLLRG